MSESACFIFPPYHFFAVTSRPVEDLNASLQGIQIGSILSRQIQRSTTGYPAISSLTFTHIYLAQIAVAEDRGSLPTGSTDFIIFST